MKILINTSTINQGGSVQVAINLIKYTINDDRHQYYYIIPKIIYDSPLLNFKNTNFLTVDKSPAKFLAAFQERINIKKYEKEVQPDIVYSVGSPSYISFKSLEVLRLTNAWLYNNSRLAYSTYNTQEKIIIYLQAQIKKLFIRRKHFIITQTDDAKSKIEQNLKINREKIFVVPNVIPDAFTQVKHAKREDVTTNILVFAAPYPHKNLGILPSVTLHLKELGLTKFKFILTYAKGIKEHEIVKLESEIKRHNLSSHFENVGKVPYAECINLYKRADILFLPTLLETFSVTLLEAMAMKVPIITTALSFNKDVCGSSALYFTPKDSIDASQKIFELINNEKLRYNLTNDALERLQQFPRSDKIYQRHIEVLERINSHYKPLSP